MQPTFECTPQFVTNPPPEPTTDADSDDAVILELPREHLFFSEGYGEFAIGDTFIINNSTESTPPIEYQITGFEGFRDETNDADFIQIICKSTEENDDDNEIAYPYTSFCDAVYKSKFVMFTSPAHLVDDINAILTPPEPKRYDLDPVTKKPLDITTLPPLDSETARYIKALQNYFYGEYHDE